jgi:hypothetical protein
MTYPENELPTRPDCPRASARRCKHCGRVYGEHAEMFPRAPDARCLGVRAYFEPEEHSDGDHER